MIYFSLMEQRRKQPIDYYSYTQLPHMDKKKLNAYCRMSPVEWEKYHQEKNAEAHRHSDRLESYIRSWYAGKAPAGLPKGLLPPSIDNEKTQNWILLRPEEVKPVDQWGMSPANEIPEDFSKLRRFNKWVDLAGELPGM